MEKERKIDKKTYYKDGTCLIVRDFLALDRTILANERTFLAWIRTALSVIGAGIGLIKVFENVLLDTIGFSMIPLGMIVFIWGIYKFLKVRKDLSNLSDIKE